MLKPQHWTVSPLSGKFFLRLVAASAHYWHTCLKVLCCKDHFIKHMLFDNRWTTDSEHGWVELLQQRLTPKVSFCLFTHRRFNGIELITKIQKYYEFFCCRKMVLSFFLFCFASIVLTLVFNLVKGFYHHH